MQRTYEIMFIVRPDILDEDLDKLIAGLEANITQGGGSIKSMEKLGRRKLAYMVKKFNDGNYVLLTINADGSLVGEIERRLRVSEPVIKFISVRMDEEEKRVAKIKAIRATRKKLSAQPAATPPAPASSLLPRQRRRPKRPAPKQYLKGTGKLWLTKPARQAHQAHPGPRARTRVSGPGGRPAWRTPQRPRRRRTQVLSPQEGLQVLCREDRRHPLSRCTPAAAVCRRAGQDSAPAPYRRLHHPSAGAGACHQAGAQHRFAAVCSPLLERSPGDWSWKSF